MPAFPREKWRFPSTGYDPHNDARKCGKCGNHLFFAPDGEWSASIQRGIDRCWRCPGKPFEPDVPSSIDGGYCKGCGTSCNVDCVRCFACYFCEATRLRKCDHSHHRGNRSVHNDCGADVKVLSPVKELPQRRWYCFPCIERTKVMLWSDFELSQSTPDNPIPVIAGFQPALLQTERDPYTAFGGKGHVWPAYDAGDYFAIVCVIGVFFPHGKTGRIRVFQVKRYERPDDKGIRLKYTRMLVDSVIIQHSIIAASDGVQVNLASEHATDYYVVHKCGVHESVTHHHHFKGNTGAYDALMSLPWRRNGVNGIVANWYDEGQLLWDGES